MKKYLIPLIFIPFFANAQLLDQKIEAETYSHQQRIKVLQEADKCIHNAKTDAEYIKCEKIENQARKDLRQEQKNKAKENVLKILNKKKQSIDKTISCVEKAPTNSEVKSCMKNFKV